MNIGASMYLCSLKEMIKLSLLFTIINFPIIIILGSASENFENDIFIFFKSLTYGAIGNGVTIGDSSISKDGFMWILMLLDIICVLLLIGFYQNLEIQQSEYAKKYDIETLTVNKFTIMLSNLPSDDFFNYDYDILRMRLWNHA